MTFEFELDHIAIAVNDLDQGFEFYKALGFSSMARETVASEKVETGFLRLQNNANLELLEAMSEDSSVHKFIQKRGPGIHHFCLRVKDIDAVLKHLKSQGVRLINEEPKLGAHNCRVVFIHPASTGGVLIELSQPMSGQSVSGKEAHHG
jgi:methylmalonyl-CoA epimerase